MTTTTSTTRCCSPVGDRLRSAAAAWARSQHQLVMLAVEFADSGQWALDGSPTAAHWIADVADIEICTAREWIRVGRRLGELTVVAAAFANLELSYSKVRALTRIAEPDSETELVALAKTVPAGQLARALATWLARNRDSKDLAAHQHQQRSVTSRVEPDGMTTFTCRLPPLVAGRFSAALDTIIMRSRPTTECAENASAEVWLEGWGTLAQQRADALDQLLTGNDTGSIDTEIVVHVRGDGCALDDGTPIPESVVRGIAPEAFIRALIHDANRRPINASARRRHPSTAQKRVVRERDRACVDCGTTHFLQYDHDPPYHQTRHTVTHELELRCTRCHRNRHRV